MKDVLVMEDLDQIKCISQPYRIQIIEAFDGQPATAKMISDALGEPHAKINYHIKEMLKHEILVLVEEVVKLGVVEKYYEPVAKRYVVHSASMQLGDREVQNSLNQYRMTIFDACSKVFYKAMEQEKLDAAIKMTLVNDCYLTKAEIEAMQEELRKVFETYSDLGNTRREGTHRYTLSAMMIPEY